ncbi:M48 family metallopeptidase [Candidatus Woesearchaeota archaeon]|nr:M48 family metallopeptidase [Candidatus Woesearchaeota archaeon]
MNLYEHVSSNKRKSILLITLFFIIITTLGYFFGFYIGVPIVGLLIAFIFSTIMVFLSYYSGDKLILKMSHATLADKREHPNLVNTVEGLSIASGIPTPKIYVINDTAINAFATGRDPKNASVTVTTGAIKRLKRDELEGVIAHELSHIRNYDIRMMMFVVILVGIVALLSDFFLRTIIYNRRHREIKGPIAALLILLGFILALLAPLISQLIKFAVSRQREYLADADGSLLSRNPQGLANALIKIKNDKEPLVEAANKATAHLFIENPLRTFKGRINSLFSTHPPIEERIKRLQSL